MLRCYPHEWSVLAQPAEAEWRYLGRFSSRPNPEQLEVMLRDGMSKLRFSASAQGSDVSGDIVIDSEG
jgi:hypothetical protein